jgi:hypothetical protein
MSTGHCRFAALALVALGWASPAWAATYQVGPGKTYQQLSAVAGMLAPGDVVELDGDHTYAGGVAFWNPGTPTQKITIRGLRVNGKRPVLSGGTNTIEAAGDHYVFEGLDLTAGSFRCFFHHAHDVVLRDSVVHHCPKHGVLGADGDSGSLLLEYTEVHHCGEGTQHHQIYMATDETANPGAVFRMQYCYVHDATGGNGVKSRAERNEIYYNWVEGSLYHELELIGPDGQNPSLAREDSDVVGNVLFKRNTFAVARCGGDGTGYTEGRYRFVNNTIVVLPGGSAVFRLFDRLDSIEMHNNVFAVLGAGTVNLVRQVEAEWVSGTALFAGSNNWVVSGSTNVPPAWTGTLSGSDPGFVDLAASDVRLQPGSALIDQGAMTTASVAGHPFPSPQPLPLWVPPLQAVPAVGAAQPRPVDSSIDIGAWEFGTGAGGAGGGAGQGGSAGAAGSGGSGQGGQAAGSGGAAGSASGAGGTAGQDGGNPGGAGAGASAGQDAGGPDGAASLGSAAEESGCGCRAARGGSGSVGLAVACLSLAWARRRVRVRRGAGVFSVTRFR